MARKLVTEEEMKNDAESFLSVLITNSLVISASPMFLLLFCFFSSFCLFSFLLLRVSWLAAVFTLQANVTVLFQNALCVFCEHLCDCASVVFC